MPGTIFAKNEQSCDSMTGGFFLGLYASKIIQKPAKCI